MASQPDASRRPLQSANAARMWTRRLHHAGVALERQLSFDSGNSDAQAQHILQIAQQAEPAAGYREAFERQARRLAPGIEGRRVFTAKVEGTIACGLGRPSPTEVGLTIHPTWGVPYIPGSSIKGVTKAWAAEAYGGTAWDKGHEDFKLLFGVAAEDDDEQTGAGAGLVSFLDALWVPGSSEQPFRAEALTPHYNSYYQKGAKGAGHDNANAPHGMDGPVPIRFLSAQGHFRIVIEGPEEWLDIAERFVEEALERRGVGAKTRSGFGVLTRTDQNPVDGNLELKNQTARIAHAPASSWIRVATQMGVTENHWYQWLRGAPTVHRALDVRPLNEADAKVAAAHLGATPEGAAALDTALQGSSKDLRRWVKEALRGPPDGDSTSSSPTPDVVQDTRDVSEAELAKLAKQKKKPNDFAKAIINGAEKGGWSSDSVVRAIEVLRKLKGFKDGHEKLVRRELGLED